MYNKASNNDSKHIIKVHKGILVVRAPNRGLESSFCWKIAGWRLAWKEYFVHRHRYHTRCKRSVYKSATNLTQSAILCSSAHILPQVSYMLPHVAMKVDYGEMRHFLVKLSPRFSPDFQSWGRRGKDYLIAFLGRAFISQAPGLKKTYCHPKEAIAVWRTSFHSRGKACSWCLSCMLSFWRKSCSL